MNSIIYSYSLYEINEKYVSYSVMSSSLNSVTVVIFEDLVRPSTDSFSEKKTCILMKIIVLIVGILCVAMAFIVDNLNTLIQVGNI